MTAEPQAQGDLVERPVAWLKEWVDANGHHERRVGFTALPPTWMASDQEITITPLFTRAALQSLEAERDQWKADAGVEHLARKKAEAALQSPGLDEEVVARIIGSWPTHEDDRGPDNEVIADFLPFESAEQILTDLARAIIALSGSGNGSQSQPCADAGTHIPRSPEVQQTLNECWRAVDALGGSYDPTDDRASGYDHALREAVREIEKLGGMWS